MTLGNGLKVFLAEDHELPLVRGTLIMRGGQRAAPASRIGGCRPSLSPPFPPPGRPIGHAPDSTGQRVHTLLVHHV